MRIIMYLTIMLLVSSYGGKMIDTAVWRQLTAQETASETTESIQETEKPEREFLLENSNTVLLKEEDLEGFSLEELRLARGEIYARYGVEFYNDKTQNYFNSKSWYHTPPGLTRYGCDDLMSELEKQNVETISNRELKLAGAPLELSAYYLTNYDILTETGVYSYGDISADYKETLPEEDTDSTYFIDRGDCYEVKNFVIATPIYYTKKLIENLKQGDALEIHDGMDMWTAEVESVEKLPAMQDLNNYRVVFTSGIDYYFQFVKDDKYILVDSLDRVSEMINFCSNRTLYKGSVFLSKDCVISEWDDVYPISDYIKKSHFLYGVIAEIDKNGYITHIAQITVS